MRSKIFRILVRLDEDRAFSPRRGKRLDTEFYLFVRIAVTDGKRDSGRNGRGDNVIIE
jgi:hypothetical protein